MMKLSNLFKLLYLLLFLVVCQLNVHGQGNTTLGTDALSAISNNAQASKIGSITLNNLGSFTFPEVTYNTSTDLIVDFKTLYTEKRDGGMKLVFNVGLYSEQALDPQTINLGISGGTINSADFSLDIYPYESGWYYYYYGTTNHTVPTVTISPLSNPIAMASLEKYDNYAPVINYTDSYPLNVYTSTPTVTISGGGSATPNMIPLPSSGSIKHTSLGEHTLKNFSYGASNTAIGYESGFNLTSGSGNTLIGTNAGYNLKSGNYNTIIGVSPLPTNTVISNTIVIADGQGSQRIYSPSSGNILIGYGNNPIDGGYKLDVNGTVRVQNGYSAFTAGNQAAQMSMYDPAGYPRFHLERGRGSINAKTQVNAGDVLGAVLFRGLRGSATATPSTLGSYQAAEISAFVQNEDVNIPNKFGTNISFRIKKTGTSGDYNLVPMFEVNADGYAKATEKFRIGTVSTGSSSDEILVRSTSDGEIKTRSISDVMGGASENFQSITDRGNVTTTSLQLKSLSSPNPNTSGLDKAYNSLGFYTDGILPNPYLENSRIESFYHNNQYVDRGGLKFYNRDGNGLQPRLTITSHGSLILGSKEDKWNAGVPVGAVTGGYNIDFHTWRDAEPDQIGGRIRAERLNVWQHNSPLVQGTDLAFSTSDGWEQTHLTERLRIKYNGNVGIGTLNPAAKLQVYDGNFFISRMSHEYAPTVDLAIGDSDTGIDWIGDGVFSLKTDDVEVQRFDHGKVIFASSSKIGIGTGSATLTEALNVNGQILTKGVKVNPEAFPDYVFKPQYKLPSLKDVESFVKENSHLPEVPSEAEVKKNGLELGEMSVILLKKVEELTLYMIEKDKQIEKANQKIEELSIEKNRQLEKANQRIEELSQKIDKLQSKK